VGFEHHAPVHGEAESPAQCLQHLQSPRQVGREHVDVRAPPRVLGVRQGPSLPSQKHELVPAHFLEEFQDGLTMQVLESAQGSSKAGQGDPSTGTMAWGREDPVERIGRADDIRPNRDVLQVASRPLDVTQGMGQRRVLGHQGQQVLHHPAGISRRQD
jgi:hypothetical protein